MGAVHNLSGIELAEFGRELDAIRDEAMASRGERDRAYLLSILVAQRRFGFFGRALILASFLLLPGWPHLFASWPAFLAMLGAGVLGLALSKILENMEIAHNVLHGQWDWMKDPAVQSSTWEWNSVCPSDQWMHSHNVVHHTWTNVLGKDRDIGYGMLRVTERQRWHPFYLLQPLNALLMMLYFEWFIALHDVEINRVLAGRKRWAEVRPMLRRIGWKVWRQLRKDFIAWPLLGAALAVPFALAGTGPAPLTVLLWVLGANLVANILRNIWTFVIIFCGHFPAGVHHFRKDEVEGETRGHWYLRQLLGSCNIEGGPLFHILSGNLSHQIEHHLFPDLCSNRYPEVAPRVRALAARYGLPYNSGSLARQFGTTVGKLLRLSLPGPAPAPVCVIPSVPGDFLERGGPSSLRSSG